jgi:hypothetical protein
MYLSQTNTLDTQAPFYVNILEEIVANGTSSERQNIDNAIYEALEVSNGHKEIFAINNRHYFFVTTLLTKYKEQLSKINMNNLTNTVYLDILNIMR